jgi:hypothetical protein
MTAVTQWYPPNIKPVHVGIYQRSWNDVIGHCYWDGMAFSKGRYDPRYAINEYESKLSRKDSIDQNLPWRGLTNPAFLSGRAA